MNHVRGWKEKGEEGRGAGKVYSSIKTIVKIYLLLYHSDESIHNDNLQV